MEFVSLSQMTLNHEPPNAKFSIRLMTHYSSRYSFFVKNSTAQMKWTFDFDVLQSMMHQQTLKICNIQNWIWQDRFRNSARFGPIIFNKYIVSSCDSNVARLLSCQTQIFVTCGYKAIKLNKACRFFMVSQTPKPTNIFKSEHYLMSFRFGSVYIFNSNTAIVSGKFQKFTVFL